MPPCCTLKLDKEKSKHMGFVWVSKNGFGPALLLPIFDWPIIIIAPGGLLLVISRDLPPICSPGFTSYGKSWRKTHT
jgi:hypothetical protein